MSTSYNRGPARCMGGLAAVLLTALLPNVRAESYHIVRIENRDGTESVEVMSASQVKTLQAEIQAEARLYPKALAAARAAWAKNPENTKPFPANAVKRRSVTPAGGSFPTEAAASERHLRMMERQTEKEQAQADKEKEREKTRYKGYDASKKRERQTAAAAKEAERELLDHQAVEAYEQELATLQAAAAAPAN